MPTCFVVYCLALENIADTPNPSVFLDVLKLNKTHAHEWQCPSTFVYLWSNLSQKVLRFIIHRYRTPRVPSSWYVDFHFFTIYQRMQIITYFSFICLNSPEHHSEGMYMYILWKKRTKENKINPTCISNRFWLILILKIMELFSP